MSIKQITLRAAAADSEYPLDGGEQFRNLKSFLSQWEKEPRFSLDLEQFQELYDNMLQFLGNGLVKVWKYGTNALTTRSTEKKAEKFKINKKLHVDDTEQGHPQGVWYGSYGPNKAIQLSEYFNQYLIVAIGEQITSAANTTYVKGDRVIVNYGTAREPEYYAGTITAIRTGKAKVLFDDGSEEVYLIPVRPAKVGIVGKTLVKRKRSTMIPKEQVEKWLMVEAPIKVPTAKTPVKKAPKEDLTPTRTNDEIQPTKPVATKPSAAPTKPPPEKERREAWWVKEQYDFVVNRVTQQDYDESPVLGAILNTGRQGPTGSGAIIGVDRFKNHLSWVVRTDHKDLRLKFVFMPFPTSVSLFTTFESMNQKARDRGAKRVSFQTLISQYRPEYAAYKKMIGEKQGDNEEQNEQKAKQFDFANSVGKQAEIQWSNGYPTWKTIVAVDVYKEVIAIRGSGTKNRWIPFRLVLNIKD